MAVDYFLMLDGIDGETQDSVFKSKKAIDLQSFAFGASNPTSIATGEGGGAGKAALSDFTVSKYIDTSSPKMFQQLCQGQHITKATVVGRKAGTDQQEYITFTFSEVFVTGISWSAASETPSEAVSFAYASVQIDYKPQKKDGTLGGAITGMWNQKTNKAQVAGA